MVFLEIKPREQWCMSISLLLLLTAILILMNGLLTNLTKFINVTLELYAPLPFEFTSDLHTLNAYLKTYSEKQQKLLEGFVNRLADKLTVKNRSVTLREDRNDTSQGCLEQVLRHYNSCTIKYPQLKLEIPTEPFQKSFNQDCKAHSYRSDRSKNEDGIKPNRHKFATRNKAKQIKMMEGDYNKQNVSLLANIKTNRDILEEGEDRSLKFIKSEAELIMPSYSHGMRNISMEAKREEKSTKSRPRYESNDNKVYHLQGQLKIKIKPRPALDLCKLIQNINQIQMTMQQNEKEINGLLSEIDFFGYSEAEEKIMY